MQALAKNATDAMKESRVPDILNLVRKLMLLSWPPFGRACVMYYHISTLIFHVHCIVQ